MNISHQVASAPLLLANSSVWTDVATAFIGAACGAGFAFAANIVFQRRQRRHKNLAAGNMALVIAKRQFDDYNELREGMLRDRDTRLGDAPDTPLWYQFRPPFFAFAEGLRFDYKSLVFLFEHDASEVVNKLAFAELRHTDLQALLERFTRFADEVQLKMDHVDASVGDTIDISEAEKIVGTALVGKMNSMTQALLDRFERDETDYVSATESLTRALLKIYEPNEVLKVWPRA